MAHLTRKKLQIITKPKRGESSLEENVGRTPVTNSSNKSTSKSTVWRVLAPFVRVTKKPKEFDDEQFSFYLKKKPEVLLRDLSTFMSDSVDLPSLFHETSDVLKKVTKSAWVSLYLVDTATNEIYQSANVLTRERHKVRWKIEDQSFVATYVAKNKEYVLVKDILLDIRFPNGVGYDGIFFP